LGWGSVQEVTPATVVALLASDAPPFLLDVRESWEWAVSNLAAYGAPLIPLAELGERMGEVPSDRPIVVYCWSGQRSLAAVPTNRLHGP